MDTVIFWFRQDLRLNDNPALHAALKHARQVIPLYIYTDDESGSWPLGGASRWWLHYSLLALNTDLEKLGSRLITRAGSSNSILLELARQTGASEIFCNALYEPDHIKRDERIKHELQQHDIQWHSYHGNLLCAPGHVRNKSDQAYKVFTPFYRYYLKHGFDTRLTSKPKQFTAVDKGVKSIKVQSLQLLPSIKWYTHFSNDWHPGEQGAKTRLQQFCHQSLEHYPVNRDIPATDGTSHLSPHLHFGEISPRQIIAALDKTVASSPKPGLGNARDALIRQLIWRDFAHHILVHFPHTADKPFNPTYENFPWKRTHKSFLKAWQQGNTGIPIIDAGMRELWLTGYMHNRVRMIVASLLAKNANLHWINGARWFWDTLVDADLANNSMNWQWVAGCGVDAAPYFRIFNPVTQGKRFDPDGEYIRRWIPELTNFPNHYIHEPWIASVDIQQQAGIIIGKDYPQPIIDISTTRKQALENYNRYRQTGANKTMPNSTENK